MYTVVVRSLVFVGLLIVEESNDVSAKVWQLLQSWLGQREADSAKQAAAQLWPRPHVTLTAVWHNVQQVTVIWSPEKLVVWS